MSKPSFITSTMLSFALAACGSRVNALESTDAATTDGQRDAAIALEAGPSTPLTCQVGTWCWRSPLPQGQAINATFVASESDAWAVGNHGAILRRVQNAWISVASPTEVDLQFMAGSGPTDVWAWGYIRPVSGDDQYAVIHWDGARWSDVAIPARTSFLQLSASGADNVWVYALVANTATILRWNGSALVAGPALPGGATVRALCARGPNDVWATAARTAGAHPTQLYHWRGADWTLAHEATAQSSERFTGLLACPADGVAVSAYFTFNSGLDELFSIRGDQVNIEALPLPESTAPALYQTPHGELYLFNARTALRWAAQGWQTAYALNNGSTYSTRFDHSTDRTVGWMADGTPYLTSLTASGWQADPEATSFSLTTFATGTIESQRDPIAAFGEQIWAHRDGDRWVRASTPVVTNGMLLSATDSWGASADRVWVVGRAGAIARYDHSARAITAATIESPTLEDLNDIDGSDASTAWAVGNGGTIYRLDGERWVTPTVPVPRVVDGLSLSSLQLVAVDVKSATDVMVLGNDVAGGRFASVFYRWNGSSWSARMSFGTTISIFDRDPEGNVYFVDGAEVKRRPLMGEDVMVARLTNDSARRLRAFGFDDFELQTYSERGSSLQQWEIDPGQLVRAFSTTAPTVFNDVIRGANNTLWGLGAFGSVAVFRASP